MEIITGVERRRWWRLEEKLRIVTETEEPGASFMVVARRHEVMRKTPGRIRKGLFDLTRGPKGKSSG